MSSCLSSPWMVGIGKFGTLCSKPFSLCFIPKIYGMVHVNLHGMKGVLSIWSCFLFLSAVILYCSSGHNSRIWPYISLNIYCKHCSWSKVYMIGTKNYWLLCFEVPCWFFIFWVIVKKSFMRRMGTKVNRGNEPFNS